MKLTLLEVFDPLFEKVKFTKQLGKSIQDFNLKYLTSNREHLQFYGNNLLGCHRLLFRDKEVNDFFLIFDLDVFQVEERIALCPSINPDFKVSSDPLNLTIMYLIHKFLKSEDITPEFKDKATRAIATTFFYRCISALNNQYFQYLADPKIMQAAYANMSNKFLVKQLGGRWQAVVDYRCEALLDEKSPKRFNELLNFQNDIRIVEIINEAQGAIRSMFKYYYANYDRTKIAQEVIGSTSSTYLDADGEETVKEKTRSVETMILQLKASMVDRDSFARKELFSLINRMNANTSERMIRDTLYWMQEQYNQPTHHKLIEEFIDLVVVQSMYFLESNLGNSSMNDYAYVCLTLKNLYLSTRSTDLDLERIKELGEKIVKLSAGRDITKALIYSTRTGVILFVSMRAIIGNKK